MHVFRWHLAAIGLISAATIVGCDRKEQSVAPASRAAPPAASPAVSPAMSPAVSSAAPTTVPVSVIPVMPPDVAVGTPATVSPTTNPAESPATTEPVTSVILINQQPVAFPAARVRFTQTDDHVTAMLYSDDPKDALDDKYTGNGFYFEMPLDAADMKFEQATWLHHSGSSERVESPYGIFLDGHRRQLQPLDVRARFSPASGGMVKVEIAGTFLMINTQDDGTPTMMVPVAGWLLADPGAKR